LREHNVFMLPCQKFHWAEPAEGDNMLRIALSRSPEAVDTATRVLRSVLLGD